MTVRRALMVLIAWALCAAMAAAAEPAAVRPSVDLRHGRLKVSADNRFLIHADGTPFFYLGDTAWELFHRLDREEAELYLKNRAAKGFTVIQAVVLAELDGLGTPNAYGHKPLDGNDPAKPNEAYFQHVDFIVDKAEALGMFVGMLPTWGDKWNHKWGKGPEIFTPENAAAYGEFLGNRYKDKPILWILGGDRSPDNDRQLAVIRAMAAGLRKGDGGNHLLTFHPQGRGNSAQWFHQDDWLSFDMFQSGHGAANFANYDFTAKTRELTPTKPVLDGEPRYEDHPIRQSGSKDWFDEWDVRQAAYWSLLAGACGHTYGNHNIWQMWQPGRQPITAARTPWKKALDYPGAAQMGHVRRLFESRPFQSLVPDQSLLVGDAGKGADHVRAARAADGACALVYLPTGKNVSIATGKLGGQKLQAWWFDPRSGTAKQIGMFAPAAQQEFDPPGEPGRGNDWVLVLDDVAKGFAAPGKQGTE
jgi:hypothetical protein